MHEDALLREPEPESVAAYRDFAAYFCGTWLGTGHDLRSRSPLWQEIRWTSPDELGVAGGESQGLLGHGTIAPDHGHFSDLACISLRARAPGLLRQVICRDWWVWMMSPGWKGNRLVWSFSRNNSNPSHQVRETVDRSGENSFVSTWEERLGDESWSTRWVLIFNRRPAAPPPID